MTTKNTRIYWKLFAPQNKNIVSKDKTYEPNRGLFNMTTNGCEGCIAYKVNRGIAEPDICENCGKQEMSWRQD